MFNKQNKAQGFSLIELVIAVGMLAFLFTIVSQGYFKQQRDIEFNVAAADLKAFIYEVREDSRTYKDQTVYGINLEKDGYQVFKWSTYTSTGVTMAVDLPGFLNLESVSLNESGQEVVFEKSSGSTDNYGTFRLNANDGQSVLYEINQQGFIKLDFDV